MNRILIRGLNWLGDAVMSTPALQRLREAKPAAHITLLTHEKLTGLWQGHPALDSVLTFADEESVFKIASRLRGEHFNTALVLPNSPRSALEVFLARVPQRIGCKRPWRSLFLTESIALAPESVPMRKRSVDEIRRSISSPRDVPSVPTKAHQIHHYLHLAETLGAAPEPLPPHIAVTSEEVAEIQERFHFSKNAEGHPRLFGLNAGAEYGPAKRWPRERFIASAKVLRQKTGCHWWIFGNQSERELAEGIAAGIQGEGGAAIDGAQSLAGKTSLRDLCAALKACDLLLTNDTGPMHLAAAVGTPVVALFGSTSLELTGPGLPGETKHLLLKSNVPCAPCFRRECPIDFRCMNGLGVEKVVEAVLAAARFKVNPSILA